MRRTPLRGNCSKRSVSASLARRALPISTPRFTKYVKRGQTPFLVGSQEKGSVPFFVGAAAAVGVALFVAASGPLRIDIGGTALSVRTATRPLLLALVLIVSHAWYSRRSAADSGPLPQALASSTARALLAGLVIAGVAG